MFGFLSRCQVHKTNQFQAKTRKWPSCTWLAGVSSSLSNYCCLSGALSSEGSCLLLFAELLVSIPEISVLVSKKAHRLKKSYCQNNDMIICIFYLVGSEVRIKFKGGFPYWELPLKFWHHTIKEWAHWCYRFWWMVSHCAVSGPHWKPTNVKSWRGSSSRCS